MELTLDPRCLETYARSASQQARCLSEGWAEENLYCANCLQPKLLVEKPGNRVFDFRCPQCRQTFNLKASMRPFEVRVADGQYDVFMRSVEDRINTNLVLMHYDRPRLVVLDLELIPQFFFTTSSVIPRNPTQPKSRSKPWRGCDISLAMVPEDGHVTLVKDERIEHREKVHETYQRTAKLLLQKSLRGRGWTTDVLRCVRDLRKSSFTLQDVYAYERKLQTLHPENKNVRPKIRQQLQVLRDHSFIVFEGKGQYRLT